MYDIYFYKIEQGWYEEHEQIVLYSWKYYSQEDFELLARTIIDKSKEYLDRDSWVGTHDLFELVVSGLEQYGFREPDYEGRIFYWGSCILKELDSMSDCVISEEAKDYIVEHNQRVEKELHSQWKKNTSTTN